MCKHIFRFFFRSRTANGFGHIIPVFLGFVTFVCKLIFEMTFLLVSFMASTHWGIEETQWGGASCRVLSNSCILILV